MENINTSTTPTAPAQTSFDKLYTFATANVNQLPKLVEKSISMDGEKNTKNKIIWWGNDNLYIEQQLFIKEQSGLLSGILDSITDQVIGKEIRIINPEQNPDAENCQQWLNNCNQNGESFFRVHSKHAQDVVNSGNGALSITWNKNAMFGLHKLGFGSAGFDLNHTDVTIVRTGECNGTGNIDYFYTCSNWSKGRTANVVDGNRNKEKDKPKEETTIIERYPAFNTKATTGTQFIWYKPYMTGRLYYGQSIWTPVTAWAEIDAATSLYHRQNLSNGFLPSLWINYTSGIPSPERAEEIYNDLIDQLSNERGGSGRAIVNFCNSKETSPEIEVLNNNDNDKKYIELASLVMQQLVSGLRANPELVGLQTPGKLGNSDLMQAQELFYNLVIRPIQEKLTEQYNSIIKARGFNCEIEIVPLQPISYVIPTEVDKYCHTIDEYRVKAGDDPLPEGRGQFTPAEIDKGKNASTVDVTAGTNPTAGATQAEQTRSKLFDLAGGLDSLGRYQVQVAAGQIPYDAAVSAIMDFFLVNEMKAKSYLGEPPVNISAQTAQSQAPAINIAQPIK